MECLLCKCSAAADVAGVDLCSTMGHILFILPLLCQNCHIFLGFIWFYCCLFVCLSLDPDLVGPCAAQTSKARATPPPPPFCPCSEKNCQLFLWTGSALFSFSPFFVFLFVCLSVYLFLPFSLFLFLFLSLCLSLCSTLDVSVYLPPFLSVPLPLSVCPPVSCPSVLMSLSLAASLSICVSLCQSVSLSLSLSFSLCVSLSVSQSVCLSVFFSVSVCLVCLSVCFCLCLSVYNYLSLSLSLLWGKCSSWLNINHYQLTNLSAFLSVCVSLSNHTDLLDVEHQRPANFVRVYSVMLSSL